MSRDVFEQWYVVNAFDYEKNPIGSRQCSLQWQAWQAATKAAESKWADVDGLAVRIYNAALDGRDDRDSIARIQNLLGGGDA